MLAVAALEPLQEMMQARRIGLATQKTPIRGRMNAACCSRVKSSIA